MMVPTLRTERLFLRGLEVSDTGAAIRLFADPEMSRFSSVDLSDPERCRASIGRRLAYNGPEGTGHWVIEFGSGIVGLAHLRRSWELPGGLIEIGYFVDRAHGGKGLATEAAKGLLQHGFATLRLPAIWAVIHKSNLASLKLAERLGFLDVGGGHHYGGPHRVHVALNGLL